MNKGDTYETLKEVIFIAFTNFSIFPNKKAYKTEHITLDRETYEHDLDKLSFTIVDLVKFQKSISQKSIEELSLEEKFYYFLRKATDIDLPTMNNLVGEDKVIKKAFHELNRVYWTDEEMRKYDAEEKVRRDNRPAAKVKNIVF